MNIIREMYIKIYMYTTTIYLKLTQTVVMFTQSLSKLTRSKFCFLLIFTGECFKVLNRILRWIAF